MARLREVEATRYVLPLREGGSLPGLVEGEDLGTYVAKFRGAGQGRKALVAEVLVGELARGLGLPVPELVALHLDPELARAEPDQEVQDLLRASSGLNLGMDFLPGSLGFDPAVDGLDPALAAKVLWFDALVLNVDRSWRNPNLLLWHGRLWLIDHGAAVYFHHDWRGREAVPTKAYDASEHALLQVAGPLAAAQEELGPRVVAAAVAAAAALVPDGWLEDEPGFRDEREVRAAYVDALVGRAQHSERWLPAVEECRVRL